METLLREKTPKPVGTSGFFYGCRRRAPYCTIGGSNRLICVGIVWAEDSRRKSAKNVVYLLHAGEIMSGGFDMQPTPDISPKGEEHG